MEELLKSIISNMTEQFKIIGDKIKTMEEKIDGLNREVPGRSISNLDPCIIYEHCGNIGEGVSGEVSQVYDKVTGEYFAMKCIPLDKNNIPPRIAREMNLLYDLDHANIVKLKRVHSYNNCVYLLMEDAGKDLYHFQECDPDSVTIEIIKDWLRQIFSALSYLHQRCIIHRDLKPENIIIGDDFKLKICDFGSGRRSTDVKRLTRLPATLVFMAPEELLGDDEYGERVDMWAVGCILYEMVARKNPFSTGQATVEAVLNEIFRKIGKPKEGSKLCSLPGYHIDEQEYQEVPDFADLVPDLDADGIDLLKALLAIDPVDRITAEQALNHPYLQVDTAAAAAAATAAAAEPKPKRSKFSNFPD